MRMNLTDEEAKLILRQREVQDAHREGWNKALERVAADLEGYSRNEEINPHTLRECILEMKK